MTEDIRERVENYNKNSEQLERTGGRLDIGAIYEGAKRAEEERAEHQRKIREDAAAAQAARDKEWMDLLAATGKHSRKEAEAQSEKEIKKAKAKADKELEAKIRKQNGLKSDEEERLDQSFGKMLGKLNFK